MQIVSFTSYNATYEPASTAKGSTQQYGRKLLQVSVLPMAPAASGNASIPATNVTFAVTLPSASQNSLLVLQSSSPTVRQQFGGWFVTQMAARGESLIIFNPSYFLSWVIPLSHHHDLNVVNELSLN